MTEIKITNTRSATASKFTVADLRALLEGAPDTSPVHINEYKGDQREPGYTTITINMAPEVRR